MRRERRGFKRFEYVDKALAKLLEIVRPIDEVEEIPVSQSVGRVSSRDVASPMDIPPFDRSAMDGYAVRSSDVSSASQNNPIRLRVIGYSTTGRGYDGEVGPGEAVRIDTGAPMPRGSDAVVMIEYVEEGDGYIDVYKSVSRYENVSLKGEDLRVGDVVVPRGRVIYPQDLPALYSLGIDTIEVYRRPVVGIVAFGSELTEDKPGPGMIKESNRPFLRAFLRDAPIELLDMGIKPDEPDTVRDTLLEMASRCDLIVSTGGTSLGGDDIVSRVVEDIGEVHVHGVALQPSKPVLIAEVSGKPYLGLPGYPVAVAISSEVFLRPAVQKLAGVRGVYVPRVVKGVLRRRVPSRPGLRHYVRVRVWREGDSYIVEPIYASGAGVTSSLALGDGYLVVPEEVEGFEKGSEVEVILYRSVVTG